MRASLMAAVYLLGAAVLYGQGTTARLDGSVTDQQGALVPAASILVTNSRTGTNYETKTDERGHWVVPALQSGLYRVRVSGKGFRTTILEGIKMDAGVPATANATLEVGQVAEVVEVAAGAEMVQTTNATVASTIQGRQIFELPFTSRNPLELLVTQAGTQTGTTVRNTFINGLPFSAINITVDGINTMDNYYKSGDGFFTVIPIRSDSVEEVTMSTSAASADSLGQGAAQVRFVTKGGTNEYHGGTFWQHRNTALNANYYFNNINGLPRDRIILNQGGVRVGGPILKNKLFFFSNFELYRIPATSAATRTVLTPDALTGKFTYADSSKNLRTVDLYKLAAATGYPSTPDPLVQKSLDLINTLTGNGSLRPRVSSNNDYNRNDLTWQPSGLSKQNYSTSRVDYYISSKHQLQLLYTYYMTNSTPDITNSVVPIFPGTGTVLGNDAVAGQRGNRFSAVVALRSTLTPKMTNEFRVGTNNAISLFRDLVSSPAMFSSWRGYSPTFNYVTSPAAVSGSSRRKSPVRELHDNITLVKGAHMLGFGGSFTQINFWGQSVGTSVIPTIAFGVATGDPINTGSTSAFTAANFPGATQTQLNEAMSMYALLTGRVSSISRQMAQDEVTHKYSNVPAVDRNRQREWGLYFQDTWRVRRDLTLTLGLRFDQQRPFENINTTYSSVSYESLWGLSGVNNFFQPGKLGGVVPSFEALKQAYAVPNSWNPSIGLAYQLPGSDSWLGKLIGRERGKSVIRAGYSIATTREGTYIYQNIFGSNQGLYYSTSVDPGSYPANFGAPGSVLFRDATLPSRAAPDSPTFPMTPLFSNSLNGFSPNMKMAYVQSWNFGFQRELSKDTVVEFRYTGNHAVKNWRQVNLNEVNIFENGFLNEFTTAQNNLAIARQTNASSVNFGNQGLAGQKDIPIIKTALGVVSDTTTATYLVRNQPGTLANSISNNATRLGRLTAAGYPANMFVVNPTVGSGGSYLVTNLGSSAYNSLQVEFRRRMSSGLMYQGSYVFAKSISNGAMSSLNDYATPTTFRNMRLDRVTPGFDIRHAYKLNTIYELPIGPGRRWLNGGPGVVRKALEGWQVASVARVQSGTPFQLTSGRSGMNNNETGVVLYNMTAADLQNMMQIRKVTASDGKGLVYYLPQAVIDNTNAAFEVNGKSRSNLDPNAPYVGPQLASGQFGNIVFLRNPWQYHLDLSAVKQTKVTEKVNVEFRAQVLDAFNLTNFFLANGPSSASFGQTTTAFRDFSGSSDPGARMVEFVLRVNF